VSVDPRKLQPQDPLGLRAEAMLKACGDFAALGIPASIPATLREPLIDDAALATALDRILLAAHATRARPMHAVALVAINRGREAGMSYVDIFDALTSSFHDAAQAHMEEEQDRKQAEARPKA